MKHRRSLRRAGQLVVAGLMVAALARELSKPSDSRRWEGSIGPIPYCFRMPTWRRVTDAYWNPDTHRLLSPRILGVGWTVNLAEAERRLELLFRRLTGTGAAPR
jgi:hypothetical protein